MQNVLEKRELPARSTALLEKPSVRTQRLRKHGPNISTDNGFQAEVRRRVDAYFKQTGKRERDQVSMYVKTLAIMFGWPGPGYLVFVAKTWWQACRRGLAGLRDGRHRLQHSARRRASCLFAPTAG